MSTGFSNTTASDQAPNQSPDASSSRSNQPNVAAQNLRDRLGAIPEVAAAYGLPQGMNTGGATNSSNSQNQQPIASTSAAPTSTSDPAPQVSTITSSSSSSSDSVVDSSNSSTSSATQLTPKSVKIVGEQFLSQIIDQKSAQVVDVFTRSFPSQDVPDLQIKIEADRSGLHVQLDCRQDEPTAIVFRFDVTRTGRGVREVHIDLAKIGYEIQQGGIVKQLMCGLLEFIEGEKKVAKISLQANIDVGGYAWARYGFEPDDPQEVVEDLQDTIKIIRQNESFTYDGVERKIVLTPDLRRQLEMLQNASGDAKNVFKLLSNSLAKVQVLGGGVEMPHSRFPGGEAISSLIDLNEHLQTPEADSEDKADYRDKVRDFDDQMQIFAESLQKALTTKTVPFSNYVIGPDGEKAIQLLLDVIKQGGADKLALAQALQSIPIVVNAEPTEVTLSALFMLGSDWEGHVQRPQSGQQSSPDSGWSRLEKYVGYDKKGSKQ